MNDGLVGFLLFVIALVLGATIAVVAILQDQDLLSKEEFERSGYTVHVYRHTVDGVSTNWIEVLRKDGKPL